MRMDRLIKEASFMESVAMSWLPTFVTWVVGACTTAYLSFIPTGAFEAWAHRTIQSNGAMSAPLVWLHKLVGANDWRLWLTIICLSLWIFDLLSRFLGGHFKKRLLDRLLRERDATIEVLREEKEWALDDVTRLESQLEAKSVEFATLQQGISDMFHKYLMHLSEAIGCQHTERISLYVLLKKEMQVDLVQRYPANGEQGKIRRTKHRVTEGVIGKVQARQSFYISKLPDPIKCFAAYAKRQKKEFDYSVEEVKNFSMVARTYYAFRVTQKDDSVGFVVIESLEKEFSNETTLGIELRKHSDFLYHMLKTFRGNIPTYENAIKENF